MNPTTKAPQRTSFRYLRRLTLIAGSSALLVVLGRDSIREATALHRLAASSHPYFVPEQAALLYLAAPVVVAASFVFFLAPGGLLALRLGWAKNASEWLIAAFGSSLALLIVAGTTFKAALSLSLDETVLLFMWSGFIVIGLLSLWLRLQRGEGLQWPFATRNDTRRLLWPLVLCTLGVAVLVPKIFWENFNLDGVEAFEFGRSLTANLLPHWEIHEGVFGFYDNFLLFAYPNHFLIELFGPVEAAARLPFFLYLALLFQGLLLLIERNGLRLSLREEAGVAAGLILFTVVQTYNSNYEPFFADLAENAATDTLLVVCFLASVYFLLEGRTLWFALFGLLTYLASPGGLLLLVGTTLMASMARKRERWQLLRPLLAMLAGCLLIGVLYQLAYQPQVLEGANNQFSTLNMLRRFSPPTLLEWDRFSAILFPSGILPAFSLLLIRREDVTNWIVGGVALVYFGVLYIQAWTSLHQFTPIMILPAVVFWRVHLRAAPRVRRVTLGGIAAGIVACGILSLPPHFEINLAARHFGLASAYRIGDYESSYEEALGGAGSLSALLPQDYRLKYPLQPWGIDPATWIYYANIEKPPGTAINYVVQTASKPAPADHKMVLNEGGIAVYVKDTGVWQAHRDQQPPRISQSALYEPILRHTYRFFREYVGTTQDEEAAIPGGRTDSSGELELG